MKFWLLFAKCFLTVLIAYGSEVSVSYQDAKASYLLGDYERARSHFDYVIALNPLDVNPTANLAIMNKELGKPEAAAAYWMKSTMMKSDDGFLWNQRGWNYHLPER